MDWLDEERPLNNAFAITPRKTGKAIIAVTDEQADKLDAVAPGFSVDGWTIDRLVRVTCILQFRFKGDKEVYFRARKPVSCCRNG
jgi:hypothetical protein